MNFETLVFFPIIVGVVVNLISFLLTNQFNKDSSDIIVGDGNIIDKSNHSLNFGDTNNTTVNNYNQPSSNSSDESPLGIILAIASIGALFYFLHNYKDIIFLLSIYIVFLLSALVTTYRNIKYTSLNAVFKKSLLSQVKMIAYKLLISSPVLIIINIWFAIGKYDDLIKLKAISEMIGQLISNHNILVSTLSLSLSMFYVLYIILVTTVKLISISSKVLIYKTDKESFTYWVLSPISKVVKNDYISSAKLRKHSIFTLIAVILVLFGVDWYFSIISKLQNIAL